MVETSFEKIVLCHQRVPLTLLLIHDVTRCVCPRINGFLMTATRQRGTEMEPFSTFFHLRALLRCVITPAGPSSPLTHS